MKKTWWLAALLAALVMVTLALMAACGDDDDDDNDDNDDFSDFPATISGTMNYEGDIQGADVLVAITDEWPMTGPPIYYTTVEIPEGGFPFDYEAGIDRTGEFYVIAAIDVDPYDVFGMNVETDPLALPEGLVTIAAGKNPGVDFTFQDPGTSWDDDDDTADDDATDDDDDDDDNDTAGVDTGIQGSIAYTGSATGDTVYLSFFSNYIPGLNVPAGAPDFWFPIDITGQSFPIEYLVDLAELEVGEKYLIYCHLDVDPEDGDFNSDVDPNTKWAPQTIQDGVVLSHNFTLIDP